MGTRTFMPTTTRSPRNTAHFEDEEDEPRHAYPQNRRRVGQTPTNPGIVAHKVSDAASVKAALSALEHYANEIDDSAKYIVAGSASTSPGPLENTLLDNLNGVRDLTEHMVAYVRGLGIPPSNLQHKGPATLARVESAIAHVEAAISSVGKRKDRRFKTDADPAQVKAELADLRVALGSSSGKAETVLPGRKHLRNATLEDNVEAANATITSISAGTTTDIARLAHQVREIAMAEPGVQLEDPARYNTHTHKVLTALVRRLDELEAKVPAAKKNDVYATARAKLDDALAKDAYGR